MPSMTTKPTARPTLNAAPGVEKQASPTSLSPEAQAARAYFPRGLEQPEGSFRFSVDALLLAAFASAERCRSFADLGTGCGVVGLGLALLHPHLSGFGIEIDLALAQAAQANAERLGLERRFGVLHADVAECTPGNPLPSPPLPAAHTTRGHVDIVVANPPWNKAGGGRLPAGALREQALVDSGSTLNSFCSAAAALLASKGFFACIYDAERLPLLLDSLRARELEPKRLCFVHGRAELPARTVLVEARKKSRPGLTVEAPLILYENTGGKKRGTLTPQAFAFCPFLSCNNGSAF